MFVISDLKLLELVDKNVQFTSTKGIMYGENIIRVELDGDKFIDEENPFKWSYRKRHVYLNDDSFNKLTQPKQNKKEWER